MARLIEMTDEQAMLLETAADFCRDQSPIEKVRAGIDEAAPLDAGLWQQVVDLGWLGIVIPTEYGGLGLGLADVVPISEQMGRYLMGTPLYASTVATNAIVECASDAQKNEWLPRIASGTVATFAVTEPDGSWLLSEVAASAEDAADAITLAGRKCFVPDLEVADLVLVSVMLEGKPRLIAVERSQIPPGAIHRDKVIDETRRSYTLDLDGIAVRPDQLLPAFDTRAIEHAALLLLCAEMAGGIVGVLHVIVDYLITRTQFGKPIGSYQSLKHPTVDILLAAEAARSHVYHAATTLRGANQREQDVALHMAKAQGSAAFAFAGDRAIQFHGGFGFTWECDAQLFLRRALWCQYQFGDERFHRNLLAPFLLDESA